MTSDDLDTEKARALMAIVAGHLRWLNRLCDRLNRIGFAPTDPLWRAAMEARNAMQSLHVASHYASCKSGVGRGRFTAAKGPSPA